MKKGFLSTKQEVSITIVIVIGLYLLLGTLVSNIFTQKSINYSTLAQSSVKPTSAEMFNYSLDSKQGDVLRNGNFEFTNTSKFSEMNQEFGVIERIKEKYTMHTSTYKCGKSTCTRTYWTWDHAGTEWLYDKKVIFDSREYDSNKFNFDNTKPIDAEVIVEKAKGRYYKESSRIRYYYKVLPKEFKGTILIDSREGKLKQHNGNQIEISDRTIDEFVADAIKSAENIGFRFWLIWILIPPAIALIGLVIYLRETY